MFNNLKNILNKDINITNKTIVSLLFISISYILLPYIIFFIGWIKIYFAIIFVLLLLVAFIFFIKSNIKIFKEEKIYFVLKLNKIFLFTAIIFTWVFLSGAGIGFQTGDYFKHNAILNDLVNKDWPVSYSIDNNKKYLVYYTAYYIPPALVGKIFNSLPVAQGVNFYWTLLGCFLGLSWLAICFRGRFILQILILFILFGGMDIVGNFLINNNFSFSGCWSLFWQFTSFTTGLFWVPQYFISCIIVTGIILFNFLNIKEEDIKKNIVFLISITFFWSPFITIGLIPYFFTTLFKKNIKQITNFFTVQNILILITIFLTVILYILSNDVSNNPKGFFWDNIFSAFGETKNNLDIYTRVIYLIVFYIVEFGIYIFFINKKGIKNRNIFYTCLICLLISPIFVYGYWNDFTMRFSMPSIFILFYFIFNDIFNNIENRINISKTLIFLALLSIGSIGSIEGIIQSLTRLNMKAKEYSIIDFEKKSLPKLFYKIQNAEIMTNQYLGSEESIFFKHISK